MNDEQRREQKTILKCDPAARKKLLCDLQSIEWVLLPWNISPNIPASIWHRR